MRDVGLLVEHGTSSDLMDLLRINSAASDLLSFALGPAPKEAISPAPVESVPENESDLRAHVLLVDDDESNRDILSRQLQRVGLPLRRLKTEKRLLEILARQKFDLFSLRDHARCGWARNASECQSTASEPARNHDFRSRRDGKRS